MIVFKNYFGGHLPAKFTMINHSTIRKLRYGTDSRNMIAMPKAELHVHLEGSVRPETLLKLARRHNIDLPADNVEGIRRWYSFRDFPHFVEIYVKISECMQTVEDVELVAREFLQGQADQTLNVQFGYQGERQDWTVSLNRVGERLRLTGRQGQPDVFQSPITVVDFKYTITLFEDWKVEASIGNLLNEEVEWLQGGEVFRAYETGIDAGLGLKYNF